jgi:predicted  nucleic acid-binding Zn-ribbon protein
MPHKCSTCHKPLSDDYVLKTCPECLEKRKEKYTVERAEKELESEGKKQTETLEKKGIVLPHVLSSFSVYQETYRNLGIEKTWQNFIQDREEAIKSQIRARADKEADRIHRSHKKNKVLCSKFLRPDLYPFTKEESCRLFRFQKLGLYPEQEPFCSDHIDLDLCKSCKEWLYALENNGIDEATQLFDGSWRLESDDGSMVVIPVYKENNPTNEDLKVLDDLIFGDSVVLRLDDKPKGKKVFFCLTEKVKIPNYPLPEPIKWYGDLWGHYEP